MISALIVWASLAFALAFVAAWAASPDLRAWIERPKYRFLESVQGYDRLARPGRAPTEPRTP